MEVLKLKIFFFKIYLQQFIVEGSKPYKVNSLEACQKVSSFTFSNKLLWKQVLVYLDAVSVFPRLLNYLFRMHISWTSFKRLDAKWTFSCESLATKLRYCVTIVVSFHVFCPLKQYQTPFRFSEPVNGAYVKLGKWINVVIV